VLDRQSVDNASGPVWQDYWQVRELRSRVRSAPVGATMSAA
jgi:hypothetical protein